MAGALGYFDSPVRVGRPDGPFPAFDKAGRPLGPDLRPITLKNNDPYWYAGAFDANGNPIERASGRAIKPGSAPRLYNGNPYGYDGYWTDPFYAGAGGPSSRQRYPSVAPSSYPASLYPQYGPSMGPTYGYGYAPESYLPTASVPLVAAPYGPVPPAYSMY